MEMGTTGLSRPTHRFSPSFGEASMIRFAKKHAQVLLAVAMGFAVSFGATQAFATSTDAKLMDDCPTRCMAECQDAGFSGGFCLYRDCACY